MASDQSLELQSLASSARCKVAAGAMGEWAMGDCECVGKARRGHARVGRKREEKMKKGIRNKVSLRGETK